MNLDELLVGIPSRRAGAADNPSIARICADSRDVRPGDLFVAIKGGKRDGHDLAGEAVRKGAVAVLAEKPLDVPSPVVVVPSTLKALSTVSARFAGNPSKFLNVWGVTGTNGKTTVTYMLENIWRTCGIPSGVVGTVEYRWKEKKRPAPNTTPLSLDMHNLLAEMRKDGVDRVAMEVSSHGLVLHRVDDVHFSGAIFTNLTQDHLDFHKDMDDYFRAKARLFELLAVSEASPPGQKIRFAIINVDDSWSKKLRGYIKGPLLTYGLKSPADVSASGVELRPEGTFFELILPSNRLPCRLKLVGEHNVLNALAAAAACMAQDIPPDKIVAGLASMKGVPGRLEKVGPEEGPFGVFVDYAHTPDALRNVLRALRPIAARRLITVFGCGGDRDRGKRPLMGEAAARLSDRVIVTSDNPRTEDPNKIVLDIEVGVRRAGASDYEIVVDRAEAIERALRGAQKGDVVLIAGKGHETYQIFKDRTIDFDDREVAAEILRRILG
jgi:UDP-N-acetylmuramoyl-L-alanyl-D-glutamate--2,6-diaminopimelate ligase